MFLADRWKDYEVIDAGNGEKLDRWGNVVLRRPDPQTVWPPEDGAVWERLADARYTRSEKGGGAWEFFHEIPERWEIGYGNLRFYVRPTGFKHTGLFPEQAVNWDWMTGLIQKRLIDKPDKPIEVLNLFAYTGGATLACAAAGANVCHLDAAKGMVAWARENVELSGLGARPIRYIIDDALKFVQRESRRSRRYDGILMDPPSYGRGPDGQVWKLEDTLFALVEACSDILSDDPLFFLINSYTTGLAPSVLANMLKKTAAAHFGGNVEAQEVGLLVTKGGIVLPCGSSGRWWAG